MSVTFPVKPITIEHDPCDASYKDTYILQLQSPAEPNGGDHICVIDFTQNRANVDWWYFDGVNDVPIIGSQSFLFTSANETYTLKARLRQDVQNVEFKPMRYTVSALYAPMWAHGEGFILPSVGTYSTECGLRVHQLATCYPSGTRFDTAAIPDDAYTSVQVIYNTVSPSPLALAKLTNGQLIYGRRANILTDKCTPQVELTGTFWRTTSNDFFKNGFIIAKVRTVHPVNGTITHCRSGYESVYPTWVCTPNAPITAIDKNNLFDVANAAPTASLIANTSGSVSNSLLSGSPGGGLIWGCVGAWTPTPVSQTITQSAPFLLSTGRISYSRSFEATQEFSFNVTSAGVNYSGTFGLSILNDCANTAAIFRVRREASGFTITPPPISCSQGDTGSIVLETDIGEMINICGISVRIILKTTSRAAGIGSSLTWTGYYEFLLRYTVP